MIDTTRVSEIMTKDVLLLDADDPIREAEKTFRNHFLRHAPVMSDGELVGMLSIVDLNNRQESNEEAEGDPHFITARVEQLMTPDPVSIQSDSTIREVATLFMENEFHAIPVLEDDRIVGIISTTDIIKFFLESYD